MTASVTVSGLDHWFGSYHALREISLSIAAGEYIALLGPSGCGKTTFLSVLGGFLIPDRGRVEIGGRDVTRLPSARRPTTTVFQDYALFPHMTLMQNVAFGPRMAGVPRRERAARAARLLELVGLSHAADKRPHEVSGGQRQRVALARALAVDPEVLLLDEPLGALDLKLRRAMQDELKALQRKVGTTFVHVTHDQEEAMAIADRIVVMNAGRIEDAGPPDRVYRAPATLFTAGFMGEINRLAGTGDGARVTTPLGPLPLAGHAGRLAVCLRPEALRVNADAGLPLGRARLLDAAFFGTHRRAHLAPETAPDLTLIAHLPAEASLPSGETVTLSADTGAFLIYPQEP